MTSVRKAYVVTSIAIVSIAVVSIAYLFGGFANPFQSAEVDRSSDTLLTSLRDVSVFEAATGDFQVLVDIEQDTPYLPAPISGERVTLFAVGRVNATVDFSGLGADSVVVTPDRTGVDITLPYPTLSVPALDLEQTRIVDRDRGLVQRVGDLFGESADDDLQQIYARAVDRIAADSTRSDLVERGQASTRQMLTGLLNSLGFEAVEIEFQADLN